jgi:hypothetical protein
VHSWYSFGVLQTSLYKCMSECPYKLRGINNYLDVFSDLLMLCLLRSLRLHCGGVKSGVSHFSLVFTTGTVDQCELLDGVAAGS